jgi:hypothetical protein
MGKLWLRYIDAALVCHGGLSCFQRIHAGTACVLMARCPKVHALQSKLVCSNSSCAPMEVISQPPQRASLTYVKLHASEVPCNHRAAALGCRIATDRHKLKAADNSVWLTAIGSAGGMYDERRGAAVLFKALRWITMLALHCICYCCCVGVSGCRVRSIEGPVSNKIYDIMLTNRR